MMSPTNDQRIAELLSLLQQCLRRFVEDRMRAEYNDRWLDRARTSLADFRASYSGTISLDVQALMRIVNDRQHKVLYNALSPRERNFLYELRDIRNRHAHQSFFEGRDVERGLDTLELFLRAIKSPEADQVSALRRPVVPPAPQVPAAKPAAAIGSSHLSVGAEGIQRGIRLFRYVAERANKGNAVGIAYGDFIAFLHGKSSFHEAAGRNYLPSDSGLAIQLAWSVTEANGGRITVTGAGKMIGSGMDTYIWSQRPPHDRPEKAFHNPKCTLPYTRADWEAIFPKELRRLIKAAELAQLS